MSIEHLKDELTIMQLRYELLKREHGDLLETMRYKDSEIEAAYAVIEQVWDILTDPLEDTYRRLQHADAVLAPYLPEPKRARVRAHLRPGKPRHADSESAAAHGIGE